MAFTQALQEHGVPSRWDAETCGRLLHVAGGFERLLHDRQTRPEAPPSLAERERLARARPASPR